MVPNPLLRIKVPSMIHPGLPVCNEISRSHWQPHLLRKFKKINKTSTSCVIIWSRYKIANVPNICCKSTCDMVGFLGMLGDLHLGGVEQVSTNSSLSMLFGTIAPTNNRSVELSSIPRPSHRPQGNLKVCPVTSFLTTTCSTIHFGDIPVLSWPIRNVDKTPIFLC